MFNSTASRQQAGWVTKPHHCRLLAPAATGIRKHITEHVINNAAGHVGRAWLQPANCIKHGYIHRPQNTFEQGRGRALSQEDVTAPHVANVADKRSIFYFRKIIYCHKGYLGHSGVFTSAFHPVQSACRRVHAFHLMDTDQSHGTAQMELFGVEGLTRFHALLLLSCTNFCREKPGKSMHAPMHADNGNVNEVLEGESTCFLSCPQCEYNL